MFINNGYFNKFQIIQVIIYFLCLHLNKYNKYIGIEKNRISRSYTYSVQRYIKYCAIDKNME